MKIPLSEYLLLYLFIMDPERKGIKIPSVRFWCSTILIIATGVQIKMKDGYIITIQDCFNEINDILTENNPIKKKVDKKT